MSSKIFRWSGAPMAAAFCGMANAYPGHGSGLMALSTALHGLGLVLA